MQSCPLLRKRVPGGSGCLTSLSVSCVTNNRVRYAELESIREQTASPLEFIQGYAKQL